jgi:anti-anti-sigma regulatory factor
VAGPEDAPGLSAPAPAQPPRPCTVVLVLDHAIMRAGVPELCARLCVLLEGSDADLVVCDVGALDTPDAATVDALARLQLAARRRGRRVTLRHARPALQDLVALAGLGDVLPDCAGSVLEVVGQAEQGEQAGIQERRHPDDPPA